MDHESGKLFIGETARKIGQGVRDAFIEPALHPNTVNLISYHIEGPNGDKDVLTSHEFSLSDVPTGLKFRASFRELAEFVLHPTASSTVSVDIVNNKVSVSRK